MTAARRLWATAGLSAGLLALPAGAEETFEQGNFRPTQARLDFTIHIDRMLYLRVGGGSSHAGGASGQGPAASGAVSTVLLPLSPMSIPGVPTVASNGVNQSVAWNTGVPTYAAAAAATLPVEVRSNAGQVSISAQASTPLSNGANVIPMSVIAISSDDNANLPAPTVPATGTGAGVNIALGGAGTAAAPSLLTYRSANWTFGYNPAIAPLPGSYSGQITFLAVVP